MSIPLLAWAKNALTTSQAAAKTLPSLHSSVGCARPAATCTARGFTGQKLSSNALPPASLSRRSFCSQAAATGQPVVKRKLGIPFALTAVAAGAGAIYVVATAGVHTAASVAIKRHVVHAHYSPSNDHSKAVAAILYLVQDYL